MNNQENYIDFKQNRDFGEVFNATFMFLRQNAKPLFMAILSYVIPFSLIAGIVTGLFQIDMNSLFTYNPANYGYSFGKFFLYYIIILIVSLIAYSMMITTTYSYITLYVEKNGAQFGMGELWLMIQKNFFKILGSNILFSLMVGFGFMMLFLPGIYLGVSLAFLFIIAIYEKRGFGSALSRSFELTHKRWWWTLLLLIVVFMIIGLINIIFSLPNMLIGFTTALNQVQSESVNYVQLFFTILSTLVSSILNVIPLTAIAFQYFSVMEEHEGKGLEDRINQIG